MYQPPIVNFPVFSVKWSEATDTDGVTTPAVLAAGGGGSGKTGVGNKISLIAVRAGATAPSHTIAFELETSPDTCCCVAASENGQLVAAAFGKTVRVFLSNPSGFHKMGEVEADFAEKDGGINSMTFSGASSHEATGSARDVVRLATGGEDGILRVWEVGAAKLPEEDTRDSSDQQESPSLQVTLGGECKGHSKPITCVVFHPAGDFVLTSSKDGTCRMWNWQRGFEMAVLPTASGLPSSVATTTVMCRSCSFSPSKPDVIFTAQSGQRGNAYVTEWKFSQADFRGQGNRGQGEGGEKAAVRPVRTKRVSSHPVTSLSIRSDGARMAVANVEGTVIVYRLPGFAKVMEYRAHDLPVTGLGFAPERAGVALEGFNLLAGSADYKITLLKSQGNAASVLAKQILAFLWSIIMFLVTVIFWVVAAIFWLLNVVESLLFVVIPLAGLVGIGLALFYHPKELLDTVRRILKLEDVGQQGNF